MAPWLGSETNIPLRISEGHVELGNPNAKTDAAGRFALKIKKNVEKPDLAEIW